MSRLERPEIHFQVNLTSDWTFFGLTQSYKKQFQESIFDLIYHSNGGFSYTDIYHMPVYLRTFYIRKLSKMHSDQKADHEKAMKAQQSTMAKAPKMRKR